MCWSVFKGGGRRMVIMVCKKTLLGTDLSYNLMEVREHFK